ncbi:MAG TPA: MFS transporter [Terracidiphilus sp.]|nr:MFS transporter [Terracidiphilus sp.]
MSTPAQPAAQSPGQPAPLGLATAAVALCGVCAFLELYCTQPLLPMLAGIFHASKTGVGLTVSAATAGVALSAPVFGALTERLPRKHVIVCSLLGISLPTLLAATASSLAQLVFWRFLQGLTVPGVIAVLVTYIGEEWPPHQIPLIMSFYVSGTALGGFLGRIASGILADHFSWRVSFVVLGLAALVGASGVALWLPAGRPRGASKPSAGRQPAFPHQVRALFRRKRLVTTFAVGFNSLFALVGVFTWITFHLTVAPYNLSTTALSSLFFVYLVGLVVTPVGGFLITRVGLRAGITGAICLAISGVLLTLAPSLAVVVTGLALLCSGVFIAQTVNSSYLRHAAPAGARVTAAGLYITFYYLGGTAAGVVPGFFWNLGKWPACVAFIVCMELIALAVALIGWRGAPETSSALEPRNP